MSAVPQPRYYGSNRPAMNATQLRTCRLFIQGTPTDEIALELGVTLWTVKDHLKQARSWLRERQHHDISNTIGLRRALRDEGLLDGVPLL